MPSADLEYFCVRALEERHRASATASPDIRDVHLEFAARYEQLAGELHIAEAMRSSRNAVHRSLELLNTTKALVGTSGCEPIEIEKQQVLA